MGDRSASADAPETTLATFKLGNAQGADGVKLDVHLTKYGKLALIHIPDTKRVAGVDGNVADRTLDEGRQDADHAGRGQHGMPGYNTRPGSALLTRTPATP